MSRVSGFGSDGSDGACHRRIPTRKDSHSDPSGNRRAPFDVRARGRGTNMQEYMDRSAGDSEIRQKRHISYIPEPGGREGGREGGWLAWPSLINFGFKTLLTVDRERKGGGERERQRRCFQLLQLLPLPPPPPPTKSH